MYFKRQYREVQHLIEKLIQSVICYSNSNNVMKALTSAGTNDIQKKWIIMDNISIYLYITQEPWKKQINIIYACCEKDESTVNKWYFLHI